MRPSHALLFLVVAAALTPLALHSLLAKRQGDRTEKIEQPHIGRVAEEHSDRNDSDNKDHNEQSERLEMATMSDICVLSLGTWKTPNPSASLDLDANPSGEDARAAAYGILGPAARDNKRDYCSIHGCRMLFFDGSLDEERPVAWSKIVGITWLLWGDNVMREPSISVNFNPSTDVGSACDWVFWMDTDAMFSSAKILLADKLNEARIKYYAEHSHDPDVIIPTKRLDGEGFRGDLESTEGMDAAIRGMNLGTFFVKKTAWARSFMAQIYGNTRFLNHPQWEQQSAQDLLQHRFSMDTVKQHAQFVLSRRFNSINAEWQVGDFVYHMPSCACCYPLRTCLSQQNTALTAYNNSL